MLAAFLTTILFSISAVTGQRSSRLIGGTEANFWRLLLGTLLLATYAHTLGKGISGAAFYVFLLSGCIGFGVGDVAFFQALPRLGSRLSVMLVLCLSSPIGGWVEWLWLGTALTLAEVVWGLVILAGVAVALTPGEHLHLHPRQWIPGIAFGLVASLCQALGAVFSRKGFMILKTAGQSLDGMTAAYQRILGGVVVAGLVMVIVKRRELLQSLIPGPAIAPAAFDASRKRRKAALWVGLNALSGSVLGVSCFQWALQTTPTGVVLPIVAITPLVIIPFSRYLEGERPTWRSLAGGAVAVTGAAALAVSR